MPITPKEFFCPDEWLCHAEQNGETILFLVKTGIFHEFSKSGLSARRLGERKTGTSDVKPGYQQRRHQKREGGVFEKKALIRLALFKSIDISSVSSIWTPVQMLKSQK